MQNWIELNIPIRYRKVDNGMRVIKVFSLGMMSTKAPKFTVNPLRC